MTRDELFQNMQQILSENFEIDPDKISPESNLYSELELDSIDAVDLVIQVQELAGKKISPEEFKAARTVNDVLDVVEKLLAA